MKNYLEKFWIQKSHKNKIWNWYESFRPTLRIIQGLKGRQNVKYTATIHMAYRSVYFVLCMTGKVQFMATKTFVPKQFMTCIVILNKSAFGTNQQFFKTTTKWLKWLWDDCQSFRSHDKTQYQIQFETKIAKSMGKFYKKRSLIQPVFLLLHWYLNHFLLLLCSISWLEHWIALEHVHFFVHGCHWLMQQWWFHDMSEIKQEGASCYLWYSFM